MMNVPFLWELGYFGDKVIIAVLDTGCDYTHKDLKNNILGGINFTDDYNGNKNEFMDNNGHGTHTTGIMVASHSSSDSYGIAPNSKIIALKVLDEHGKGNSDNIIKGIKFCIDWNEKKGQNKINIISMSLGSELNTVELYDVIREAVRKNIIIVGSAGNNGDGDLYSEEIQYPSIYDNVIQVCAMDKNKRITNFSNTNKFVDIAAPGVDIKSTFLNNSYAIFSGTSQATPHVSAVIALLINKYRFEARQDPSYLQLLEYFYKHTKLLGLSSYREIDLRMNGGAQSLVSSPESEAFLKHN